MKSILEVFIKISENEGIKITQLEEKIGASKGVLSRAIKNNSDIQAKWLLKLVENYPQYNERWLLTGEGNMLKKSTPSQEVQEVHDDKYTTSLEKQVALLEKNNALQEEKIAGLEKIIKELKNNLQKTIAKQENDIINLQGEGISAMKSPNIPPDDPLQPSRRV
ncbi:MAG: hypothetical protein ACTTJM_09160 [Bergeyella cardium]